MNRSLLLCFLISLILLAAVPQVKGDDSITGSSSGSYDLSWHTIGAGGWSSGPDSDYAMWGVIGQADAGLLLGDSYVLGGGFLGGGELSGEHYWVYLPVVLRH